MCAALARTCEYANHVVTRYTKGASPPQANARLELRACPWLLRAYRCATGGCCDSAAKGCLKTNALSEEKENAANQYKNTTRCHWLFSTTTHNSFVQQQSYLSTKYYVRDARRLYCTFRMQIDTKQLIVQQSFELPRVRSAGDYVCAARSAAA